MKQGKATVDGAYDRKREPIAHAVSETAVSQMGMALRYTGRALYEGRGLEAPMAGEENHKHGSQGRHS